MVNFWKGIESSYSSATHGGGIYLCTDSGNVYIFGQKHINVPENGLNGLVLTWKDKPVWGNINIEDLLSYGVEWDITVSDTHLTRIGNPLLHKSLPILSLFRGCIALGNLIQYYLNASDWSKKEDGSASRLDGYDGTVLVHTPEWYFKFETDGNKRRAKVSTVKIDSTWIEVPAMLLDAYRCTVLNTVPEDMGYLSTLPVNSAVSIVNESDYCRGGTNNSSYDQYLESDQFRTMLGKPRTSLSRANMRTYCKNAGRLMLSYDLYKNIFYWLYVIEYANFNSLDTYNAELTADGYRQGGLGPGVTTGNYSYWGYYNGYTPLTPCGYCNDIGNGTGVKEMTIVMPTSEEGDTTQSYTFYVPRWRGFDNPFGDLWTNLDGVLIDTPLAGASDTSVLPTCYIITDPEKYTDSLAEVLTNAARSFQMPHGEGYIKELQIGQYGDIVPKVIGGNATTYMGDYYYVNYDDTPEILFVGGRVSSGSSAGLGYFNACNGVGHALVGDGFRSVSFPA